MPETDDGGRPYFVMDLVTGVPITEYADTARLDVRGRLSLFLGLSARWSSMRISAACSIAISSRRTFW